MKQLKLTISALLMAALSFAQSPQKFSYQAVLRNAVNQILSNQNVGIKVSILRGINKDSVVYVETHSATTNSNGLVSLEIGAGTVVSGTIAGIDWGKGPFYIKTEADLNGGTNYSVVGTSQLLSVPYALHASSASSVTNLSLNLDQLSDVNAAGPQTNQVLGWDGAAWVPQTNESSKWTLLNGNIYRNAGNVGINSINPDYPLTINWNGQSGPENATRGIFVNVTAKNTVGSFLNQGIYSFLNTDAASGRSINGVAAGANSGVGVVGESNNKKAGQGVAGYALSSTGDASQKVGVFGWARGAWDNSGTGSGDHIGLMGISNASATSVNNIGVSGESAGASTNNYGGSFLSSGSGLRNNGIFSITNGSGNLNAGVLGAGNASKGDINVGIWGVLLQSKATMNYPVFGSNDLALVSGYNVGVHGYAIKNSLENYGIDGTSDSPVGISYGTTGWAYGKGSANYAIYGYAAGDAPLKYAGFFDGNVTITGTLSNPSDKRLKTNIKPLDPMSDKLLTLNVYNYEYRKNAINLPEGTQFGFMAQDVEALFPNLVKEELVPIHSLETIVAEDGKEYVKKTKVGEERFKSINYIGLIPVLTKTIQEQQKKIVDLEERLKKIEERLN